MGYLEREVMDRRRKAGKQFTAVNFQGTRHVQHYRKHKDQYEAVVTEFLRKSFGQVEDIQEEEQELGIIHRDSRVMETGPQSSGARERFLLIRVFRRINYNSFDHDGGHLFKDMSCIY